jgi:hypothetical protein
MSVINPIFPPIPGSQYLPYYPPVAIEDNDTPSLTSYLGTKFYAQVELKKVNQQRDNALGNQFSASSDSLILKSCLVSITPTKNIIKTAINGRNGTIKEYISQGDFVINVKGLIVSEDASAPMTYPEREINLFWEIVNYVGQLDIINHNINKVVTRVIVDDQGTDLNEIEGSINQLAFTLQLLSDDNPLNTDTSTI